ncbi:hypothetical protein BC831DRAFT_440570 [Entophlyctis helioformis]|nr:hypothetical protein BC831DRAFT_440570 [Entophlyctis helioformis]
MHLLASQQALLALPVSRSMTAIGRPDAAFFARHVFMTHPTDPCLLLSVQGMRAVVNRNRLFLLGPVPSEDELVRQWTSRDAEGEVGGGGDDEGKTQRVSKRRTLWDSFPAIRSGSGSGGSGSDASAAGEAAGREQDADAMDLPITRYPSLELYSAERIVHQLQLTDKDGNCSGSASVQLLLISRPIMDDDMEHQSWSPQSPSPPPKPNTESVEQPATASTGPMVDASEPLIIPFMGRGAMPPVVRARTVSPPSPSVRPSQLSSALASTAPPLATPSAPSAVPSAAQAASAAAATLLALPSQVLDTINPFTALPSLFSRPDQPPLPPVAHRHASLATYTPLLTFMGLMHDARSAIILAQAHRFAGELDSTVSALDPSATAGSGAGGSGGVAGGALLPLGRSVSGGGGGGGRRTSEMLAGKVHGYVDAMAGFLASIRFVRVQGDAYMAEVLDGLETYLLGRHHDLILAVSRAEEEESDARLSIRLSVLGLTSFGLAELGVDGIVEDDAFWRAVKAAGLELLRFEREIVPARMIERLIQVHGHLVDYITGLQQRDASASTTLDGATSAQITNADTLLGLLIFVVFKSRPTRLVSALRYTQLYRHPSLLDGQASYCLVNLDAAVSYLCTALDLSLFDLPADVLDSLSTPAPTQTQAQTQAQAQALTNGRHGRSGSLPITFAGPSAAMLFSGISAVGGDVHKAVTRLWTSRPSPSPSPSPVPAPTAAMSMSMPVPAVPVAKTGSADSMGSMGSVGGMGVRPPRTSSRSAASSPASSAASVDTRAWGHLAPTSVPAGLPATTATETADTDTDTTAASLLPSAGDHDAVSPAASDTSTFSDRFRESLRGRSKSKSPVRDPSPTPSPSRR